MVGLRQCRLDALDAAQKSFAIVGLQQIVERLYIEGSNCILRVGGGEYNVRRFHAANGFENVEAAVRAQLNVEIHDIRFASGDFRNRGLHAIGLRNHGEFRQRRQETQQLGARRRLIVDYDNRVGQFVTGKLTVTTVPVGWPAASAKLCAPGNSNSKRRVTFESPVPGFTVVSPIPTPSSPMV